MTTVTATVYGFRTRSDTRQRLSLSLALSVAAHVVAIAMFAGLLQPMLTPVPARPGQTLPIEVELVGARPIAFAVPPEMPAQATELPIAPQPTKSLSSQPAPAPSPAQAELPVTTQPFGVSVRSDANADAISANAAPPHGDTSVRPVTDSKRLGSVQSMRLAQRFPRAAATPPKLREPLIVPYPARAASAYAEARIAVLLLLDATGRIVDTTIFPDESLFGPTIRAALNGVRFAPAVAEAKPIDYWIILEFVFTIRPTRAPRLPPSN